MIRKQLYITEHQDRVLKRRARALGISEAELVRRALDQALHGTDTAPLPRQAEALEALLAQTRRLSEEHRLPDGYRFDRAALYEERENRWQR